MSDPDDFERARELGKLPLRVMVAALSAVTGDTTRPAVACHVDPRPTRPPPPGSRDDACPECGGEVCVCEHPDLVEMLP